MARVAIVTGGASGIGRALSAALVRRGDHVVLADIDADAPTAVAERNLRRLLTLGLTRSDGTWAVGTV